MAVITKLLLAFLVQVLAGVSIGVLVHLLNLLIDRKFKK